jgi:sugar phosphate isomerase/epimerase
MRIGARAHDFGTLPADELAARLASHGMCCAQLALNKAIAGLDLKPGDLNPGLAWDIGRTFARHDVQIAVLGCYINPLHPEDKVRRQLLDFFHDHLRYARDMGCGLVGLETGTPNPDYAPDPNTGSEATFLALLHSLEDLVTQAEHHGVSVAVEGVTAHTVSTPLKMRRVLDALPSKNLQVIFDPVNFISGDNWEAQDRIIEESFQLFGDRIAIIHAKDFTVADGVYRQMPTGQGQLNYDLLCSLIAQHKPGISILLEEAGPEVVAHCVAHIEGHWPQGA